MTGGLSGRQRAALTRYETLIRQDRHLFEGRSVRPIVLDLQVIADHAIKDKLVLGVVAETPQVLFVVDLVESRTANGEVRRHPYLRVISRAQLRGGANVAVLGTIENSSFGRVGDVILINQERHAIGKILEEIPRGFGEPNTPGEIQALEELATETGFTGESARLLGTTMSDSGLTDSVVSFYHVPVTKLAERQPEPEEAIIGVRFVRRAELWRDIRAGRVQDSFTLQALALYEESLRSGGPSVVGE